MPSPIGHGLAAYAAARLAGAGFEPQPRLPALAAAAIGVLPDLDLVPGLITGTLGRFHHGATHSLAAAAFAGLVAGMVARGQGARFLPYFLAVAAAWASHSALDMLGPAPTPSAGVELFWPFSHRYYNLPRPLFPGIEQARGLSLPWAFLTEANLRIALREALLVGPIAAAAWAVARLERRRR